MKPNTKVTKNTKIAFSKKGFGFVAFAIFVLLLCCQEFVDSL